MKLTKNQIVMLIVLLLISSIGLCAEPFAKGSYLGRIPPGPVAQVFAPGLICDTRPHQWEAFGTFSADGNTFCFQRVSGVYVTENTDQGWTTPELIKSIPANTWSPWSIGLSPNANSIFFARALGRGFNRSLYRCNRTAHGWSEPLRLEPPLSSMGNETSCSIAANNSIYFNSSRGGPGSSYFWVAPFVSDTWTEAIHINFDLSNLRPCCPGIAPDESFMVFTAKDLPSGYGHRDLYLTLRLPDGTWSKPRNLGPRINTTFIEHGPRISPDKKYLFFNRSNGWDPGIHAADIYWVALKEYLPESYR
jgi:hypothetical protein